MGHMLKFWYNILFEKSGGIFMTNYNKELIQLQNNCIEFMKNNRVSRLYISKWQNLNMETHIDIEDIESIENLVIGEIVDKQDGFFFKEDNNIIISIKKEIYKLLCTTSNEYDAERENIVEIVEKFIPVISASLAGKLGADIAIITGIVSIIICGCFKIGKNAWCNCFVSEFDN